MKPADELARLAREAYTAYAEKANWRSVQDQPLSQWEGVGERIQENWQAAVHAVLAELQDHGRQNIEDLITLAVARTR